jgi:formylglycine-generating enzyme required for sulfatase activity
VFGFLGSRGWSRAAIAAATGLSESRVRGIRQGRQQITSHEVLERIADGLRIHRGLVGLAYVEDTADPLLSQAPGPGGLGRAGTDVTTWRHPVDGKLMALVPEGAFRFGPQNAMAWLPAYLIDVTPVTNADYAGFVAATGHAPPPHWSGDVPPIDLREHPVVHVTHGDATAYTLWAGKALPTEEQWEKAARGDGGIIYPWGNQPTPAKCNVRETGIGQTTPVGLYRSGVSPYGVSDLSGNVWEWCATETTPGRFALRGSAFTSPFTAAAASVANDASADMKDDDTGFRCVCAAP